MNKKISLGITIGLLFLVIAVTAAVTTSLVSKEYNSVFKDLPEKLERYEIIDELDKIINNNYYGNNSDVNFDTAIARGYISGLGDNYSQYLTADEYVEYQYKTQGDMSGIGIEYVKNSKGYLKVTEVFNGSPAETAGLKEDDVIIAFDGIMIDENNYSESIAKLEGDKLTSVNLTYRRDKKDTTVNIVKGYEAQSVKYDTYSQIGYIKIYDFYESTPSLVSEAVNKLTSSGVKGLIIDVRDNTGADYEIAVKTLDVFVPTNDSEFPAASIVDENGAVVSNFTTTAGEVNIPMAVLVNSQTQAAAELFACDMRDFQKAELVGNTTKGIGLNRKAFRLTNGDAVLLSVGVVKPYRSDVFHKNGVVPDVEADLEEKTNKLSLDSQFLAAVSLISPDE
ncbi:MAG: S41 family peptidase [Acutalibacteraceae bacterium]